MSAVDVLIPLVSVIVGAVIGFLGSLGFDLWKERRDKKKLRDRIKEELTIIQREVHEDLEKEAFQSRAFFTEGFQALKPDLIRKLDATTFRAVLETYITIDQLRIRVSSSPDVNKAEYMKAAEAIKKAIDLLK
jgi:sensor domain CHASE-containing protein